MGKRRDGRESAVQFLYQFDMQASTVGELLPHFWNLRVGPAGKCNVPPASRQYAETLIRGVVQFREEIDKKISSLTRNYSLNRIAGVDRNVLRLGFYELMHCTDVPPAVIINECIEIAKKFGSDESGRFVNGILDRFRSELPPRPAPAAKSSPRPSPSASGKMGAKANTLTKPASTADSDGDAGAGGNIETGSSSNSSSTEAAAPPQI